VAYFDEILVIAVLGFLGTVAISKYLLKGDIID
jgi:multisubunit Na+/H+ antiporter MnhF subunit